MKKKLIIIGLVIGLAILVSGFILIIRRSKTAQAPISSNTTLGEGKTAFIDCGNDTNCLSSKLSSCQPATFSRDFTTPTGSKYLITIYGQEDDKCHYNFKVIDGEGLLVIGSDCQMPLTSISSDTFNHLFGLDIGAAKEEQSKLYSTYCTDLSQK